MFFFVEGPGLLEQTSKLPETKASGPPTLAIILASVGVLVVVSTVIGCFLFCRRRNAKDGRNTEDEEEGDNDEELEEEEDVSYDDEY